MQKYLYFFIITLIFTNTLYSQKDSVAVKQTKKQIRLFKKQKKEVYKDSIVLKNGNFLVGEIKKMDKNVLVIKTPFSDSDFKVKWHKVAKIHSDRIFIVSLTDGQRIRSSIHSDSKNKGEVMVYSGEQSFNVAAKDVIFLDPIGKSFISRLTVDVDIGISLTKANDLRQFNSNISAKYTANKWSSDGYFKSVLSKQEGVDDIKRIDGRLNFQYFLPKDWFVQTTAIYLINNEQLLKLRSTYKGGLGYFFIRNNRMYLGASAGLAFTSEIFTDDSPQKNSGEVYVGIGFNNYDVDNLSLLTSVVVFPSLTESGRYRTDVNFDMKYDLPLDFFVKMSLTYNYDNKPLEGVAKDDYVFTTSFGWEFN